MQNNAAVVCHNSVLGQEKQVRQHPHMLNVDFFEVLRAQQIDGKVEPAEAREPLQTISLHLQVSLRIPDHLIRPNRQRVLQRKAEHEIANVISFLEMMKACLWNASR